MLTDKMIGWRRNVLFIPPIAFKNTIASPTSVTAPVTGSPFAGISLTATGTATEGGIILPRDVDPNFPLGFRVVGNAATALTDLANLTWTVLARFSALNGVATVDAATGALDTVIGATTVTAGAGMRHVSNRGIKNAGFLTRAQILAGAVMQFSITLTTVTTGTIGNALILSGLLLDYMPMRTRQPHSERDDNWTTDDIF